MSAPQELHGSVLLERSEDESQRAARGRRVAGQDPIKRQQIIEAAKICFMRDGFEAASMNDITAMAGVSKGTLYVYFEDKEDLFTSLCRSQREQLLSFAQQELEAASSVAEGLQRFGVAVTTRLTSDVVIRAQRMVLGVAERMPRLAASFFGPEPFSGVVVLKNYLDARVTAGDLVIEDTELAARQFMDLSMASIFKRRLFNIMQEEPSAEAVAHMVEKAVDMFLTYYGTASRCL
jgi:AcrR family transcriptional regulator